MAPSRKRTSKKRTTRSSQINIKPVKRSEALKETKRKAEQAMKATLSALIETTKLRNTVIVKPKAIELSDDILEAYSEDFKSDPMNEARKNTVTECGIQLTTMKRDIMQKHNVAYSHLLPKTPRATSQDGTGRCWLFAATNIMRTYMIEEYNLNDRFELSQAYLFFYDKLERSHFFLEKMLELRSVDVHDPVYSHCLLSHTPMNDGGNWSYVCNLVAKYGVVPKSVFRESYNSSYSDEMNELLHTKLCKFNSWIRSNLELSEEDVRAKIVQEMLPEIYKILAICIGEPPKPNEEFTWEYNQASKNFESLRQKGDYESVEGLTPRTFYNVYVKPSLDLDEMVHLVHDPRSTHEKNRTFKVEHSGQVVGGLPEIMFSVDIDAMKQAAAESITENNPVWFACDY